MSRNKRWFGYLFFCVVVTLGFLYCRFPSDALKRYIQARANAASPALSLSIDRIKPCLLFGIKSEQAKLSLKERPGTMLFKADSLIVRPEVWSLVKGRSNYRFTCLAYGGDIKGYISFKEKNMKVPFDTELSIRDVQIGTYGFIKELFGGHVDGILQGTIDYGAQSKDLLHGTGKANLRLLHGRVDLLVPLLNLKSIEFDEITMDMILKEQKMDITRCVLQSPLLRGSLSGIIHVEKRLENSTLNLKGTIEPLASFFKKNRGIYAALSIFKQRLKKGVPSFVITGTVSKPRLQFT